VTCGTPLGSVPSWITAGGVTNDRHLPDFEAIQERGCRGGEHSRKPSSLIVR
jgi:SpoIIAA-like